MSGILQTKSSCKRKFQDELMQIKKALKIPGYQIAEEYLGIGEQYFSDIIRGKQELDPSDQLAKLILLLHKTLLSKLTESAERKLEEYCRITKKDPHEFISEAIERYGQPTVDAIKSVVPIVEEAPNEIIERIPNLFKYSTTPLILTDAGGKTIWINSAFTDMCGYKLDDLKGKKPGEILQANPLSKQTMRDAINQKLPATVDILNYRKNGTEYRAHIEMSPTIDGYFAAAERDAPDKTLRNTLNAFVESINSIVADAEAAASLDDAIEVSNQRPGLPPKRKAVSPTDNKREQGSGVEGRSLNQRGPAKEAQE